MRRFFLFSFMVFILIASDSVYGQAPAPFFYYYSAEEEQFIIQRADGSDFRVFAEFSEPDMQSVIGPGWSSSGEWFAWYTTILGMLGGPSSLNLASLDEKYTIAEECTTPKTVAWSQSDDLLLFNCPLYMDDNFDLRYIVYDPNSKSKLLNLSTSDFSLSGESPENSRVEWIPSSDRIAFYYDDVDAISDTDKKMMVVTSTGEIVMQSDFYSEWIVWFKPYWSTSGHVIYQSDEGKTITLEDISGNRHEAFAFDAEALLWVDWSPSGEYALVYGGEVEDYHEWHAASLSVWLLSVESETLTWLSDTARMLPQLAYEDRFQPNSTWSPEGELAFLVTEEYQLYIVNPEQDTLLEILDETARQIYPEQVRWTEDGENLAFFTYEEVHLPHDLYILDVQSYEKNLVSGDASIVFNTLDFSPDGQYLAYSGRNCGGVCIFNLSTYEITAIPFVVPEGHTPIATEFLWHSESNWLFAAGNIQGAFRSLNVIDVASQTSQYIGECSILTSCFGWYPGTHISG